MPSWTEDSAVTPLWTPDGGPIGVFDGYVFDSNVFDTTYLEVSDDSTTGAWTSESSL